MKKAITFFIIILFSITLVSCNFEEQKEYNLQNPTRVAFLGLDIIDILEETGFDKTGIKEMGMLFKNNKLPSLEDFINNKEVINLGSHNAIDYTKLDILDPELIILSGRTTSKAYELEERYPQAEIYDASQKLSTGNLVESLNKNVEFLINKFPLIKKDLNDYLNNIKTEIQLIKEKNNNTRALVVMLSGDEIRSNGPNSRFGSIYKEFGFIIANEKLQSEESHGALISYETINEYNPQVIFVLDRTATIGQNTAVDFNAFKTNNMIKETLAGINNNIYMLDGEAWYFTNGGFMATKQMIKDVNQWFNN